MIKSGKKKPLVKIVTDKEFIYSLDKDERLEIEGPQGITTVVIKDGQVCVEDSPCPNKTCIKGGWISKPGQWLCCAPNQVIILIED
ncbi:MAG: NusG domain II-containing protein [Treponema sp.]|nr:NusG domain II-containing protein [Treponema sp.]